MRSSSKKSGGSKSNTNRGLSDRVSTLHQRLCHALNLGFSDRSYGNKERKWHSSDTETQRLVVRSISAFLECITADMLQLTSLRDSVSDMIRALEAILFLKNEAILSVAANEAVKLVSILPKSMFETHVLILIHPLSSLLSFHQSQVAVACAIALHKILSKLSIRSEDEAWMILEGMQTVSLIVCNLRDFSSGTVPIDYFREMASLLSIILLRWPPARYHVWNDAKLMNVLQDIWVEYDISTKVAILHLYSSIALCFYGASKLLVDGEALVQMVADHTDASQPVLVRAEAFKLAQCLAMNEQGCKKIMSTCCEQIIKATISAMGGRISYSQKVANDQMLLIVEACRFALVTRWAGEHHFFFWKLGVDRVLLGLLLNNVDKDKSYQNFNSLQQQITIAEEGLKACPLQVLRPYIWDVLGWLVTHCSKEFNPNKHGDKCSFSMLVTCACLVFVDLIHKGYRMCQDDPNSVLRSESACHAVLMMIYSPSKYIAAQSRSTLSEILKLYDKDYLKYSVNTLNSTLHGNNFGKPDNLQTLISLMSLTCYSILPQYQKDVIEFEGIKTLMAFLKSCLHNQVHIGRPRVALHLHDTFNEQMCCWDSMNDWEGRDYLLLLSLQGLAEMVRYSFSVRNNRDTISDTMGYSAAQLIDELQEICIEPDSLAPGPRWYAVYILSHFGVYDFQSPLGNRIRKFLNGEHADMQLILADSKSLNVHSIILMARCPSLLPPGEPLPNEKALDSSCENSMKEVHLSAYICYEPLLKLMEFIYSGYMLAEDHLVTSLKILARRCNVVPLSQLLSRKIPQWGTPFPRFDLTVTLGPAGHQFADVIMEAKATKMMQWTCSFCSVSAPHMHVHKVILCSSCDYLRALLQSGMQESNSKRIKVPICWEALSKLVNWFYFGKLPKPVFGCLWDSMDSEEKLHELLPYVELSWLADYWFLNDVQEDSYRVIDSCLNSCQHLSLKIMQTAAEFSLWKLTETAANYMAPLYHQLRDSGDLEALDEDLIDMVRAASVRHLSQPNQN